jgi:hydroxymethylbilane synthase
VRLGTRGSALALAQAATVAQMLEALGEAVEVVPVTTAGDRAADGDGAARGEPGGDKARFVRELEERLLAGEIDLAVHSAKDMPSKLPPGLALVGVPERIDARDALCDAAELAELGEGAVVGTASARRRAQLLALRPDLDVRPLRGNVDTRLSKLAAGDYDALVLARAGLERLGRADEGAPLPPALMTPAAGQGSLALEARAGDERAATDAAAVSERGAHIALAAERAAVAELGASCTTPVAVHADLHYGVMRLSAFVGLPDGSAWIRDSLEGDPLHPGRVGRELGGRLLAAGAAEMLREAERSAAGA